MRHTNKRQPQNNAGSNNEPANRLTGQTPPPSSGDAAEPEQVVETGLRFEPDELEAPVPPATPATAPPASSTPPSAPTGQASPTAAAFNPYSAEAMYVPLPAEASVPVKTQLRRIVVRKPGSVWWFRVHPSPKYSNQTYLLDLKDGKGIYYISPAISDLVKTHTAIGLHALHLCVNSGGTPFIWPYRLISGDGKTSSWATSAQEAVAVAKEAWIQLEPNWGAQGYDIHETDATIPEPKWPELTWEQIATLAFKNTTIDSLDHPALRQVLTGA